MSAARVPAALVLATAIGEGADLAAIEESGAIDLRISADDAETRGRAGEALGAALPTLARTEAQAGDVAAVWLSADRWLLLGPHESIARAERTLEAALAGRRAALARVDDGWVGFVLSGPDAESILLRASASDLTRTDLKPGLARLFLLGQVKTLLRIRETSVTFIADVWTPRSYAAYAVDMLTQAARSPHDLPLWSAAPRT